MSFLKKRSKLLERVLWNKLHKSTFFIIFGPTDQKLCGNENSKRNLGKQASVGTN
jgi:hypothetical protein